MGNRNKHSVELHGKSTSINVDPRFWYALREWARNRGMHLYELINEIADKNPGANLSSEVRIQTLEHFKRGYNWEAERKPGR